MRAALVASIVLFLLPAAVAPAGEAPAKALSVFAKENLAAWCIVPFDSAQRGPRERAEMLQRLGLRRLAYDWRDQHVATFEEEILEMKKHGVEFFAFWEFHPAIVPLIKKHGIRPQIWKMIPVPAAATQEAKVEGAGKALLPLVGQTRELGVKLALYNHGGWGGEPANMVAVVQWLRKNAPAEHVGIVYNFHHGHEHIGDFAQALAAMQPYLFCLNLNGMNDNANPKILTIGAGRHDRTMMATVLKSGYAGPIGILNHREDADAEKILAENLAGMKKVLREIGDEAALKTY